MALPLSGGCTRLNFPPPTKFRNRLTVSATLSPPRPDTVNCVEATSSFFDQDTRPIMLFDGVCNLCNGGVRLVRDVDRNRRIRFEALQSEAGKKLLRRSGRAPDDISSVVLVEKDSYCTMGFHFSLMKFVDGKNIRGESNKSWKAIIYQVRGSVEDHGIPGIAFPPACILSTVCTLVHKGFYV
ncbi:hypothetical protein DITRI_Ditri19aG0124200 [Diplodiscus trichospermus]